MNDVSITFEDLSHALRVLLEADLRANRYGLLVTDRAEAVGNIETGLASVLNGFHSLYDAIQKEVQPEPIDWYRTPPLATILALRNARHHNLARKVRTLYTFHYQEAENPGRMKQYILVDFPPTDGPDADTFNVYISWSDFDRLLALPRAQSKLREETCQLIRAYLGSSRFGEYAIHYHLRMDQVFLNVVPLLVNAAAKIVPLIQERVDHNLSRVTCFEVCSLIWHRRIHRTTR